MHCIEAQWGEMDCVMKSIYDLTLKKNYEIVTTPHGVDEFETESIES